MIDYKVYRFPENGRAKAALLCDQLEYVCGEAVEAAEALGQEHIIEELWDTIHAAEGALRKFRPQQVLDGYYKVVAKCQCRGDYDVQDLVNGDWGI